MFTGHCQSSRGRLKAPFEVRRCTNEPMIESNGAAQDIAVVESVS